MKGSTGSFAHGAKSFLIWMISMELHAVKEALLKILCYSVRAYFSVVQAYFIRVAHLRKIGLF